MAESDTYRAALNGCEMRYRRVGAGQPVVLVHTLRTQLEYFRALTDEIDRTRYDVIALYFPGHGESTAPRVDYTADYFSDAVEALLEYCGLHEVVLVGESIGGSIALILAARGNPRLRRVVTLNRYDYGRWAESAVARRSTTGSSRRCFGRAAGRSCRTRPHGECFVW